MSDAAGSSYYYADDVREEQYSAAHQPQVQSWAGYGHMPVHPDHPYAPPFVPQTDYNHLPQSAYTQQYYASVPVGPYGVPYSAAQGSAGYAYQAMNPAPVPIAPTAASPPLPPHNTKTRESGHSSNASIDASYPVEEGYAHDHDHHDAVHCHDQHGQYVPPTYAQQYPINNNDWRRPSIMPPIPITAQSRSSTLANALGDVTLSLDSPTSTTTHTPPSQNAWPTPPAPEDNVLPDTPVTEDDEEGIMHNITFIHETGSPSSTTPSTASRARASDSPSEVEPQQPPRKRRRGPNKGPRKDPGFLACFFCRGRKISCNAPPAGSEDKACEQCAKRDLVCEFPTISRRGQRAHKRKDVLLDVGGVPMPHRVDLDHTLLPVDVQDAQLVAEHAPESE